MCVYAAVFTLCSSLVPLRSQRRIIWPPPSPCPSSIAHRLLAACVGLALRSFRWRRWRTSWWSTCWTCCAARSAASASITTTRGQPLSVSLCSATLASAVGAGLSPLRVHRWCVRAGRPSAPSPISTRPPGTGPSECCFLEPRSSSLTSLLPDVVQELARWLLPVLQRSPGGSQGLQVQRPTQVLSGERGGGGWRMHTSGNNHDLPIFPMVPATPSGPYTIAHSRVLQPRGQRRRFLGSPWLSRSFSSRACLPVKDVNATAVHANKGHLWTAGPSLHRLQEASGEALAGRWLRRG